MFRRIRSMPVFTQTLGAIIFMAPPTMFGYLVGRLHGLDKEEQAFHEGLCEGLLMAGHKVDKK